jgi:hypothetical protein
VLASKLIIRQGAEFPQGVHAVCDNAQAFHDRGRIH